MAKTNYFEQRLTLRDAAITDIRAYLEREGETVVKNFGGVNGPHRVILRIDEPYVLIHNTSVTVVDTRTLCLIADMLNQMP